MQSIQTKYLPATNTLGSRIKATCERGSITIWYPHDLSGDEVHREAARALVWRFIEEDKNQNSTPPASNPWGREFVSGSLPDGTMAHIFI
jgi:hypothetical protein